MTSIFRSAIDRAGFPTVVVSLGIVFPLSTTVLFRQAYRTVVRLIISFLIAGELRVIRTVLGRIYKAFASGGSLSWIEAVNSAPIFVVLFGPSQREKALTGALSNLGRKSLSCAPAVVLAVLNLGSSSLRMILPIEMIDKGWTVFWRAMRVR